MRPFRVSLAASAVMLALGAGSASAQFTNIYFFGDSLTDSGSYKPRVAAGHGLVHDEPGPRLVAGARGALRRHRRAGQSGRDRISPRAVRASPAAGRARQSADRHRNAHRDAGARTSRAAALDSGALYTVWGGANDIFFQLGALRGGRDHAGATAGERAPPPATSCSRSGFCRRPARATSSSSTCRISATSPAGVASGQPAQLSAISGLYNTTLIGGLDAARHTDDARQHLRAVQRDRRQSGGVRLRRMSSTPACGATPSLLCTSANLVAPDAASTFVFADGVHPTTAATR